MWPTHKAIGHMSYKCFQVIWCNIYLVKPDGADDGGDDSDSSDKGEDMDNDDGSQPQDERWFAKAAPIIDLVNKTSKKVWKFPAFCVSIDEQMKKFKGPLDNLFTVSKVLSGARAMNAAICGTARARQGWPPKEYKNIFDEHFNSLYWINNKDNFQIQ